MIEIGKNISDFELETCWGEEITRTKLSEIEFEIFQNNEVRKTRLSDYRGKWLVMLFYPADFTFVCPTELEEAADNYEKLKELTRGQRITPEDLKAFVDNLDIPEQAKAELRELTPGTYLGNAIEQAKSI